MKYLDKALTPEKRAEILLKDMTVEEKMGQVNCYFPQNPGDYRQLEAFPQGVGQVSMLEMRGLKTLEECVEFQTEIQKRIMAKSRHGIPAVFHMEGLCGAFIQEAVSFPSGIGRGSSWNPVLEEKIAEIVGRQERTLGITQTLAPVLDISRDSRMGRQGETYGEDPALASAMGVAFAKGLQAGETDGLKTEAVAKHFLAFHHSEGGIHGAHVEVTNRTLREVYAKPFQAAISEARLRGIMPSYNSMDGEPMSASKKILTGLLREEMGFDGVTLSDYCAIANIHEVHKVCESLTDAGLRAMDAGLDSELHFVKCYNSELADWFASGKADKAILDKAALRILTAKFRMGLFENPFAYAKRNIREVFHQDQDAQISLQSARESLILLKNDGVLPMMSDVKKVAVIGCHAATPRTFFGGYTHFSMTEGLQAAISTMAGLQSEKGSERAEIDTYPGSPVQIDMPELEALMQHQKPGIKSLLEQLRKELPNTVIEYAHGYPIAGTDTSGHEAALEIAGKADLVILTLGGKHGTGIISSMGEGVDASDINLPPCQEMFIEKLAALGKACVAVHFNGRPISSNGADKHIGAILEAWNPAEFGALAIAEVLLGRYNPGGKLPVSVARHAGQIPVYYNHPNGSSYHQGEGIAFADYVDLSHKPRYCFGHGLSYTSFAYDNLTLSANELKPEDMLKITVDVKNTGLVQGDEIIQLYYKDRFASVTRPVMELAGFKRLPLNPGEKRPVSFILKASQLAFLDRDMRWKIEAGEYEILIGKSSEDIRLRGEFRVTTDGFVEGRNRGFYAETMALEENN